MQFQKQGIKYIYIEDITWPRGDTKFLLECWKIFHEWAQRTSEIFFSTREEKFRISKRPCNILSIIQTPMKYQTSLLKKFFGLKGVVYYEAKAMVIFSHVKITCYFHMWRYQIFARKLTWYFIGVYIINRGYYMAAWGYEFYLRVLKVSLTSEWNERVRDTFLISNSCNLNHNINLYIIHFT